MTPDNDFFRLDQDQWFQEFVESELSTKVQYTNPHPQKFTFDDVPF